MTENPVVKSKPPFLGVFTIYSSSNGFGACFTQAAWIVDVCRVLGKRTENAVTCTDMIRDFSIEDVLRSIKNPSPTGGCKIPGP